MTRAQMLASAMRSSPVDRLLSGFGSAIVILREGAEASKLAHASRLAAEAAELERDAAGAAVHASDAALEARRAQLRAQTALEWSKVLETMALEVKQIEVVTSSLDGGEVAQRVIGMAHALRELARAFSDTAILDARAAVTAAVRL